MGKVKRGGYQFVKWVGDHPPRHIHVYKGGRMVLKFDQEKRRVITGEITRKILKYILELEEKGHI